MNEKSKVGRSAGGQVGEGQCGSHLAAKVLELCGDVPKPALFLRHLETLKPDVLKAKIQTLEAQAGRHPDPQNSWRSYCKSVPDVNS